MANYWVDQSKIHHTYTRFEDRAFNPTPFTNSRNANDLYPAFRGRPKSQTLTERYQKDDQNQQEIRDRAG